LSINELQTEYFTCDFLLVGSVFKISDLVFLLLPSYFNSILFKSEMEYNHNYFMEHAFREAKLAFRESEVPIGAIVVIKNKIIGRGHNRTEALKDATAHAEMIAITSAAESYGDWRLDDSILYSTIEPCAMCAGAAVLSRIKTIVYGAPDPRFGACDSLFNIPTDTRLNHRIEIVSGVMAEESVELMQLFFKQVRNNKEKIN